MHPGQLQQILKMWICKHRCIKTQNTSENSLTEALKQLKECVNVTQSTISERIGKDPEEGDTLRCEKLLVKFAFQTEKR